VVFFGRIFAAVRGWRLGAEAVGAWGGPAREWRARRGSRSRQRGGRKKSVRRQTWRRRAPDRRFCPAETGRRLRYSGKRGRQLSKKGSVFKWGERSSVFPTISPMWDGWSRLVEPVERVWVGEGVERGGGGGDCNVEGDTAAADGGAGGGRSLPRVPRRTTSVDAGVAKKAGIHCFFLFCFSSTGTIACRSAGGDILLRIGVKCQ